VLLSKEDIAHLSTKEITRLIHDWSLWARPNQLPPDLPQSANYSKERVDWDYWIALAGRGFGKTRLGAEQVLRWVDKGYRRIAIIAPTTADTRDVVTEGESGIMRIAHPSKRPNYEPSKRRLTFPNGAIATLYSAEEPERLRGPQFDAAWLDEIAAWQYPQEVWDMLHFGLRLGKHPQVVVSTTPKPIPLIKSLIERAKKNPNSVVLTAGSTYDNKANLARTFFTQVAQYEGTRLGRQELYAELIDPRETGIVKDSWINMYPRDMPLPKFEIILQSYDTAFTEKTLDRKTKDPDPSAQSTWGVFKITPELRKLSRNPPKSHIRYGVMLLDAWTDHLGFPELRQKVQKEYNSSLYGPEGEERKADIVLIEDKGSGISLRQDLQLVVPVRPYNPGRADKLQRLHAVSNLPCSGMVYVPESQRKPLTFINWSDQLLEQVCSYPLVDHDDLMDTATQALQYLKDDGWLIPDEPEEEDEYADDHQTARSNPYAA
jgi:phage terminase large subunit-like protein